MNNERIAGARTMRSQIGAAVPAPIIEAPPRTAAPRKTAISARRVCFFMVVSALALRLAVMAFLYPERLNPARDHWKFAGETGRIARSLAAGQGFSSPLFADTGPTAWLTPVFPSLLAGACEIFGVYTKSSALAILALDCIFSALTCIPVFFIARRSFGEREALWAGWIWTFFPYSIFFAADFIWETTLATFFFALLFWMALRLADTPQSLTRDRADDETRKNTSAAEAASQSSAETARLKACPDETKALGSSGASETATDRVATVRGLRVSANSAGKAGDLASSRAHLKMAATEAASRNPVGLSVCHSEPVPMQPAQSEESALAFPAPPLANTLVKRWFAFGALCGVAALTEPVLMSVFPLIALWMLIRLRREFRFQPKLWLAPGAAAILAMIVITGPWFIRNAQAFHKFVPLRDNLGFELYCGNNKDSWHWDPPGYHPSDSAEEWREYRTLGETNYVALKGREAFAFIRAHKALYVEQTLRRIVYLWTGYWSFARRYLAQEPFDPENIVFCSALTIFALLGLRRLFRERGWRGAAPYVIALVCFPLVYYFTHPEDYYRRPLDPVFVVLAAAAIAAWTRRRTHSGIGERQKIAERVN